MRDLDPEVIAFAVGVFLCCVCVGTTLRALLLAELYIPAGAMLGAVVGVLVYFDKLKVKRKG